MLFFFIAGLSENIFCQQIPILNLTIAIEHPKNIGLSDFVESITYIPLATTFDCIVEKNPHIYVTKQYVITVGIYGCLVFNRKDGEFIREIRHYGRGPGEYQSTQGFLNELTNVYYFKGWNGTLMKYTMDGVFKGTLKIPAYADNFDSPSYPMNYSFIGESIIVCDFLIALGTENNALMLFNENGEILKTVPNRNILKTNQKYVFRTGETSFYHFDNNLYFQNLYNDTVFRISPDQIAPYFILNRGKHSPSFESKWWTWEKQLQSNFISQPQYCECKRFISFNFYLSKKKYFALYDKSMKSLKVDENNSGIKNDIDGFINITFDSMNSEGELIGIIQANELVNWIEKNPETFKVLNEGLKKLQNIKMTDNPVVVIAKYKE